MEIDLAEAFTGTKVNLRVPTRVKCEACDGTGSRGQGTRRRKPARPARAPARFAAQQGFFLIERTCPTCGGQGRVIRNPCRICQGAGTVQRERSSRCAIPAGVEDGTRIRLSGEGEAGGQGAQNGDLYVHVSIRPHEFFQREQANILMRVPLRMTQAALGGEIEVPVIDGTRAKVKIPAGTQTGDQFRLRGKGFSVLRSAARGDMFIQVAVETPQNLSSRQRELLEEFEAEADKGSKGSPDHEGFFAKVRRSSRAAGDSHLGAASRRHKPRPSDDRIRVGLRSLTDPGMRSSGPSEQHRVDPPSGQCLSAAETNYREHDQIWPSASHTGDRFGPHSPAAKSRHRSDPVGRTGRA